MTAQTLIDSAKDMPFMAWKAKAVDYLETAGFSADQMPEKKADLMAALETLAEDEAPAAPVVAKAPNESVEVDLLKKYAPFFLLDENTGEWVAQGEVTQTIPAGIAYLRRDEAERVLERGQGRATANTFRQMRG